MKTLLIVTALIMAIGLSALLASCNKDDDHNPNAENCARYVSFEVETISNVSPDPSEGITDLSQLDVAEQLMLTPTSVKCSVETCVFKDGTFEGTVQVLPSSGFYDYPTHTAGVGIGEKPLFNRAEIDRTGSISYFDENDSLLSTGFSSFEQSALLAMLLNLNRMTDTLTGENFQLVLQAFSGAGYTVDSLPQENIITVGQPVGGGFSRLLWDKDRRALVGQEDYDDNGNLMQAYRIYLAGGFGDIKVVGHEFRTSFQSPFSDVKMNIFRRSFITNFVMQ